MAHLAATLMVLCPVTPGAQLRTLGVARSVLEVNDAPDWLSLPSSAEIRVPSGVRLEVVSTSIVSNEARKEAALVGMFRNVGRALNGAALSLSYIGSDGESIVASTSNGALVSAVLTDGLLPFRFPLLVLTVVLLDNNRQVLDVLTGEPVRVTGGRYKFELRGTMPVANKTRDVQVWVEALTR